MKRKAGIYALAGLLAASALTGCSSSIDENDVAVTVGDTEITGAEANFYARYTQAQYETYYAGYMGDDMWNSEAEEGQSYEEFVKDSILDQLEDMVFLYPMQKNRLYRKRQTSLTRPMDWMRKRRYPGMWILWSGS